MGYGNDIYTDVRFDWAGSLRLAASMWAYADELESLQSTRRAQAHVALRSWRGPYGFEFARRATTDDGNLRNLAGSLRTDAYAWAEAWKRAMDQQNWKLYARRCREIEEARSAAQELVDFFNGIEYPPPPAPVARPAPPSFAPTACLGG